MSRQTVREMVDEIMVQITDSGPEVEALVRNKIQSNYDHFCRMRNWKELTNRLSGSLVTVDGQDYLAFPEDCVQPMSIVDVDGDWRLVRRDIQEQDESLVTLIGQSNNPVRYYSDIGYQATSAPLSAADEVAVLTESDSDVSIDITVEGIRSSPEIMDKETITTQTSSPSSISTDGLITWRAGWSITSISAAPGLTGYITIHEQSTSGNVLAYLTEHNRSSKYFVIQLENDPGASKNLTMVYKRRALPLVEDDQVPVIDVCTGIVEATLADLKRADEQYSQSGYHDRKAKEYIGGVVSEQEGQSRASHRSRPAAAMYRRRYTGRKA